MSTDVQHILRSFELLTDIEKREVVSEIVRRSAELENPPLTDAELVSIAEDLFLELDRRESKEG